MRKPSGYWTYENTLNEAKKYKTKGDFRDNCPSAYTIAHRNNWIKDYAWLTNRDGWLSNRKWTYEAIKEESKKYKTKKEFDNGSHSAYTIALKHGWISDFTWFVDGNKLRAEKRRLWTHDTVRTEALKYKTKSDFARSSAGAYNVACKNKWIDEFTWLEDKRFDLYTDKVDSVYVYEFKEQKSAYVGRTLMRNQKFRDWEHIFREDSVSSFAKSNNIPIPEMKILEDNLTIKEGSEREGYWVEKYRSDGWTILNVAKTGSIGALGNGKWNYKSTYEEAKKYKTRKEFQVNSPSAYGSARRNKWLDDYTWFIDGWSLVEKKWTEKSTKEEAKKYRTKQEFRESRSGAYSAAYKNGWIKDYDWFENGQLIRAERERKWTHEATKAEASKYNSRSEFKTKSGSAYSAALKNKWLDEFFPKVK